MTFDLKFFVCLVSTIALILGACAEVTFLLLNKMAKEVFFVVSCFYHLF